MSPTTYRIAPELRRCCWYWIGAAPFLALAQAYLLERGTWRPRGGQAELPDYIVYGYFFYAIIALLLCLPLLWRLRLDESGVARRRLFAWDHWPWQDFASGRINKRFGYTLIDPSRPWGRRKMRLDFLAPDQRSEVVAGINAHYRLPPPPAVPDTLTIRLGFRTQAVFDASGIRTLSRGAERSYRWAEVQRLLIERHDPVRRDFVTLQLDLPDHVIELSCLYHDAGKPTPTWSGATAEEVNELLARHVPADRIKVGILGEPAPDFPLRQKRLVKLKRSLRAAPIWMALLLIVLAATALTVAMRDGVVAGTLGPASTLALFGPFFFLVHRRLRLQIRDLERQT